MEIIGNKVCLFTIRTSRSSVHVVVVASGNKVGEPKCAAADGSRSVETPVTLPFDCRKTSSGTISRDDTARHPIGGNCFGADH